MKRAAWCVLPLLVLAACQREKKADPAAVASAAVSAEAVTPAAAASTPVAVAATQPAAHGNSAAKATTVVAAVPTHDQHVSAAKAEIVKTNFRQELLKLEAESDDDTK